MTDDLESARERADYPELPLRKAIRALIEERARFHDWRQTNPNSKEQTALQDYAAERVHATLDELHRYSPKPLGTRDTEADALATAINKRIGELMVKRGAKKG